MAALCWIVVAAAAQLAWLVEPWLAAAPAVLGAIVVGSVVAGTTRQRAGCALLVLSAAAAPAAPIAAWVASACAAGLALGLARSATSADPLATLSRHIERSRRSGEPAYVFVAATQALSEDSLRQLGGAFRLADSVQVVDSGDGPMLCGVVSDTGDFQLDGMRSRLRFVLGADAEPGWARFPQDGATLEVLLERAAAGARSAEPASEKIPLPARTALAPIGE